MDIETIDITGEVPLMETRSPANFDQGLFSEEVEASPTENPVEPLEVEEVSQDPNFETFPQIALGWSRPPQREFSLQLDRSKFSFIEPQFTTVADLEVEIFDRSVWILDPRGSVNPYSERESMAIVNPENPGLNFALEIIRFLLYFDDTREIKSGAPLVTVMIRRQELPVVILVAKIFKQIDWHFVIVSREAIPYSREIPLVEGKALEIPLVTQVGERILKIPVTLVKSPNAAYRSLRGISRDRRLTVISLLRAVFAGNINEAILNHNDLAIKTLRELGESLHQACWQFNLPWGGEGVIRNYPDIKVYKQMFGRTSATFTTMIATQRQLRAPTVEWNSRVYEQLLGDFNTRQRHRQLFRLPNRYPSSPPEGFDRISQRMIMADLSNFLEFPDPQLAENFQQRFIELITKSL